MNNINESLAEARRRREKQSGLLNFIQRAVQWVRSQEIGMIHVVYFFLMAIGMFAVIEVWRIWAISNGENLAHIPVLDWPIEILAKHLRR